MSGGTMACKHAIVPPDMPDMDSYSELVFAVGRCSPQWPITNLFCP